MAEWVEDGDGWHSKDYGDGKCWAKQVELGWHWQAIRSEERISGSEPTEEEAKRKAEQVMALPVETFNRLVVEDLTERIEALAKRILAISPTAKVLTGYQVGWSVGWHDCLESVHDAIGGLK